MTRQASEPSRPDGWRSEKQIRTCLGCGRRDRQERLLPLGLDEAGRLVADATRRLPGRHGYCCRTAACLERLLKNRKRIARALRVEAVEFDEGLQCLFGSKA